MKKKRHWMLDRRELVLIFVEKRTENGYARRAVNIGSKLARRLQGKMDSRKQQHTNRSKKMENKETEIFRIGDELVPCYETKADCEDAIEECWDCDYYLDNGEAGRPHLEPRYIVRGGKRRWYIYAEYNYYLGTFNARKDGPYERAY